MNTQQTQTNHQPDAAMFSLWREVSELTIDTREVVESMLNEESDFEVDNYRFIREADIDDIQREELGNDLYTLGCFNASFLAGILNIDSDVIEAMQQAEAFEAVGKLIMSMDKLEELQESYAGLDGYGHHFNHWDGSEETIGDYYVFRTN